MKAILLSVMTLLVATCSGGNMAPQTSLINEPVSNAVADLADDARYYKETPSGKLEMHFIFPEGYDPQREKPYPAVVNFCGGAWVEGKMEWAQGNARYMAEQGFIGIGVQYRLADYRNVSALDAMMDATSSIRWVRMHSQEFNIDPDRIIAMGDSAGGHLALNTAMFPHFAESSEDLTISSVPNAVFSVAGAVNIAQRRDTYFKRLLLRREKPVNCSPYHNVRPGLPPVYMTHCVEDDILPFRYTEEFVEMMREAGNKAELYPVPGGSHLATWEDQAIRDIWEEAMKGAIADLGWDL